MAASCLPITGSFIPSIPRHSFLTQPSSSSSSSSSVLHWDLIGKTLTRLHTPTRGHAFRLLADPNVSSGSRSFKKEVVMVDPLEAKKLAAKQMEEFKAKENFQRRRRIEAINGAWAMIGLTAALVLEGQTGKGILGQLDGYWHAVVNFVFR